MLKLRLDARKVNGSSWPVDVGVPFSQGCLQSGQRPTLYDPEGRLVPVQTEEVVAWPDGSVRWLMLRTILQMDFAGEFFNLAFAGEVGDRSSQKCELEIDQMIGRIQIDTGGLKAIIPENQPEVLGQIVVNQRTLLQTGGNSTVVDRAGRVYRQMPPRVVKVELAGPIHGIVLVEGDYGGPHSAYGYRYRLHFYAGSSLLRLEHTIVNRASGQENHYLQKVGLDFQPGETAEKLVFETRQGADLKQFSASQYHVDGQVIDGRYSGWASLPGQLSLGLVDFWQRFPASLTLNQGNLTVNLLDDDSESGMIFSPGEAQSHDLWLWFGDGSPTATDMMSLVNHRPLLIPSPVWYCESQAMGPLVPRDPGRHTSYEQGIEKGLQDKLETRERLVEYGYRNYGDSRYKAMPNGWLNNEYDWGHAYFLQFARTGERRFLELAAACVRHTMDTDIVHYRAAPEDYFIGAPISHNTEHTKFGVDLGHAWLEGLFDYWVLLGEPRALEHAVAMADFFARCVGFVDGPRYKNLPGPRRPGWGLIALNYAYQYTLDSKYLTAAGEIVEICQREQNPDTGAWVYAGGGLDDPRFPVGKTFMVALTLTGIQRYHEVTGEKRAAELLLRGVDWAIDYMWDEKVGGFRSIDTPYDSLGRSPGSSANHLMEPLAYAFRLTGNPRYRYVASRTWKVWIEDDCNLVLHPSAIRDTVHYLPFHDRRGLAYQGVFPLKSIEPPESLCLRGFCAVDQERVWAVGLYGLMLHSVDAGRTWRKVDSGCSEHLYGIDFVGDSGWAVGAADYVLASSDGGTGWRQIDTSDVAGSKYHHDLKMLDRQTGYLCGCGHVWKTENGGESWRRIWNVNSDGRWDKVSKALSMAAVFRDRIWVVGSYRLVMTLEQGGARAVRQDGLPIIAFAIDFVDHMTGFAAGLDGSIGKTVDGGKTWQVQAGLAPGCLWDISFYDNQLGYAVGQDGTVLVSLNGGTDWRVAESGVGHQLRAVVVLSEQVALAAGDGGVVLRTENQGRRWELINLQ